MPAITGNYIGVIYTLNRMDKISMYYQMSVAPPLETQHFNMHGLIIHTKLQHCNIIYAGLIAQAFILVDNLGYSAMYLN